MSAFIDILKGWFEELIVGFIRGIVRFFYRGSIWCFQIIVRKCRGK